MATEGTDAHSSEGREGEGKGIAQAHLKAPLAVGDSRYPPDDITGLSARNAGRMAAALIQMQTMLRQSPGTHGQR